MIFETKKDLLRVSVLKNKYYLDPAVYRLIKNDSLSNVISSINEKSLLYKINLENEFNAEDFLKLLNRLVEIFRDTFPNILIAEYVLEEIFNSNIKQIEDYFFNYNSNDKILVEKIYKIIINNFISNKKYIDGIKTLLKEKHIELKEIDNYSLEESYTILELLSDLIICKKGRNYHILLFENIDKNLNKIKKSKKVKKHNYEAYKKSFINSYITKYNCIFNSYNKKKKYLKYFK